MAAAKLKTELKGAGSKFAALSSVPAAKKPVKTAAAAKVEEDDEDPERKKKDGESDTDYAKRMEDMDEKEKQAAAEGGKEGDEDDDEKKNAAAFAEGYKMAHARWSTVLASANAAGRVALACQLLDDTELSAAQIDGVLAMSPIGAAQANTPLARRMANANIPVPAIEGGTAPKPGSDADVVAQCLAAASKARGDKPATAPGV